MKTSEQTKWMMAGSPALWAVLIVAMGALMSGCSSDGGYVPRQAPTRVEQPNPASNQNNASGADRMDQWRKENQELRDAEREKKRLELGLPPGSPLPEEKSAPSNPKTEPATKSKYSTGKVSLSGDDAKLVNGRERPGVAESAPAKHPEQLDVWRRSRQEFITAESAWNFQWSAPDLEGREDSRHYKKGATLLNPVPAPMPNPKESKLRAIPQRAMRPTPGTPALASTNPLAPPPDAVPFRSISRTDEMWIIARETLVASAPSDDLPGGGALLAKIAEREVPVPLKHTDVKASISAYIATVDVTQQFHNPFNEKIEAVYVFPLPENAAVNEFIMVIGDRRIRGIIRDRVEAEQIYQAARSQGHTASLLTQDRPNIFTQSVANIEPGKKIDVNIKYFHTLSYVDGWYEFVFPMVVGPRFNPPGSTKGVGSVGHGRTGASGQATEVEYLRPTERSGHDIAVRVEVDAGVKIEESMTRTHLTTKKTSAPEKLVVTLNKSDSIPNKDFILRYRVAGERIKSSLLTHKDERGGFFTLMLYPPADLKSFQRAPMEMVFVLDCSGSMSGRPLEQAKAAIERSLKHLQPDDTFQLVNFSVTASQLGPQPLPATEENLRKALRYLESLNSEGGTMMIEGIKAALNFPHDPARLRFVSFMTDGYIGNETEILAEMERRLGSTRVFSFGVGTSVNRYLLDSMAKLGRGAVAYLNPTDSATEVMDLFFDRISHPAMTDLQIDWGGVEVTDVYPKRLPDLFVGRPVILTGRYAGTQMTPIRVTGKAGKGESEIKLAANAIKGSATHKGLPSVWARMKIADLSEQSLIDRNEAFPVQIKRVALDYNLMSAFTAFVAVDSSRQTTGARGTTVPVPVPVPDGVKYSTTVSER